MKVVVIPSDGFVAVDGRGFSNLSFSAPASVHAMVWKDTVGDAQILDAAGAIVANQPVETLDDYQSALAAWEVARAAADTPVAPLSLAERRALVWERVKVAREQRRQAGVLAAGHWFHSNDTSRIQQIGLVLMGASIPVGQTWRTMDNGEVPLTQTLAAQIFQAVATSDAAHLQAAKNLRALVDASPEPESVDITAGWPEIYTAVAV